jgi:hypothetical protein
MPIKKINTGQELYVYMTNSKGEYTLLYKKWYTEMGLPGGSGLISQNDSRDDSPLGRAQGSFRTSDVWQHVEAPEK